MSHEDNTPRYHLRDGFYFSRQLDLIRIQAPGGEVFVPVNEWASAIAFTSRRGENAETHAEVEALLQKRPPAPKPKEQGQ